MTDHRSSCWKTTTLGAVLALGCTTVLLATLALVWPQADPWSWYTSIGLGAAGILIALATMWLSLITAGGLIALRRDAFEEQGRPYAPDARRESVSIPSIAKWSSALRRCFAFGDDARASLGLRPGELIEVRSLDEILKTLDGNGTLDGVPFMPEMVPYCGARARVFRRIDKLNDWINSTGLKRMRDLVLLEDLRCDGSAHGGCQSNCHLRWREAWLRRTKSVVSITASDQPPPRPDLVADLHRLAMRGDDAASGKRYVCQATELTAGGNPLRWGDPRHYARDLLTGNVRLGPFVVGVALACFNWVQQRRGGVVFPAYAIGTSPTSPHGALGLQAGELVRVKSKRLIELTLNNRSRNRGLWFDREMLRFCGGQYRIRTRVERVIVEKTGELRLLTNPCILLEGVTAGGEYLGFNPENEHIFWREIWLDRVTPISSSQVNELAESGNVAPNIRSTR
jgi:hypothetical protein